MKDIIFARNKQGETEPTSGEIKMNIRKLGNWEGWMGVLDLHNSGNELSLDLHKTGKELGLDLHKSGNKLNLDLYESSNELSLDLYKSGNELSLDLHSLIFLTFGVSPNGISFFGINQFSHICILTFTDTRCIIP